MRAPSHVLIMTPRSEDAALARVRPETALHTDEILLHSWVAIDGFPGQQVVDAIDPERGTERNY